MEHIEGRVRREVRAMTRREVMTKAIARQLTWMQAAQVLDIAPRHLGRIRQRYQPWKVFAPLGQSLPSLIGLSGSPSMSMPRRPLVHTF